MMTDDSIKKYVFKPGLPQEFEIVGIAPLYQEFKESITAPHRTGFYHIIWFQKGHPTHVVDFNPLKIKPNTLLFLNKDTVQRFDATELSEGKAILFTDNFFCKTDADTYFLKSNILFNDLFTISHIDMPPDSALENIFRLLETECTHRKDTHQSDILRNLLHSFLLLSEREKKKQGFTEIKKSADLEYIMLFRDLLEANYHRSKQVSYYAQLMHITEKRLNQASAKILDKSPKQMIDERVILEAKRLLAHTHKNVKEIGFELGFEEPTNFIKYFRKHCRATPVAFRTQLTPA